MKNLPPDGSSALFRARRPKSWWRTPQIDILAATLHAVQLANWQRGGGKGEKPKAVKLPEDKEVKVKTADELLAKRRRQSEHLKKRRAAKAAAQAEQQKRR